MKRALLLMLSMILLPAALTLAVHDHPAVAQEESKNPVNTLMKDLTKYYVVLFSKGPGWGAGSEYILEAKAKESAQFHELVESGKLVGVVRITGNEKLKALAFLKTDSKDEAWAIADSVKAVKEKVLTPEVYHIWGTKGMGVKIKEEMAMGKKTEKRHSLVLSMFTKGANWREDVPEDSTKAWASRHAAAVLKWKESGSLKFYGAVDDTGPLRVMGIFSGMTVESAKKKLAAAPAVRGGWFAAEAYSCLVLDGVLP